MSSRTTLKRLRRGVSCHGQIDDAELPALVVRRSLVLCLTRLLVESGTPPDWCIALLRIIPALANAGPALTGARVPRDSQTASLATTAERGLQPSPEGLVQSIRQVYGVNTGSASGSGPRSGYLRDFQALDAALEEVATLLTVKN
ncbi:MAG: hypothetical protein JSU86_20475 [Phycisphaerales bacterium]|nr:MAG: hypothetical protein JSU86_20475 [Phycisphaerales bacterium]